MAALRPDLKNEKSDDQQAETADKKKVRNTGASGQPAANDAAKFRLYPTDEQYNLIARTFGCTRFLWNFMIDIALITYEQLGFSITIQPAEAKRLEGLEFLSEVDSLALSSVYANYNQAWENHKNNPATHGCPTYKTRKGLVGSYTTCNQPKWDNDKQEFITPGSIRIEDGKLHLPKVGWVDIKQHYDLPDDAVIKNVTVSRDCAGRVYASIGFYNPELARLLEEAGLDTTKEQLVITGLDYSNPSLFVNELGLSPTDVHFYKRSEAKLAKLQRKLARRKPGSANHRKLKQRIARLHRKIANQRKDLLHKLSHELAVKCDVVVVEDLDMKAMGKRKSGGKYSFGKSVNDNAWGTFLTLLEYKLTRHHGQLVKVGRYFPSSKTCHHCGARNDGLGLSDRAWTCPECGAKLDRDVNAAWNILLEGVRLLREGALGGVRVEAGTRFICADGTAVAAGTPMPRSGACPDGARPGGTGAGVMPVEACETEGEVVFSYCSRDTALRTGDAELSEAGKETVRSPQGIPVITEAPASAPVRA